MTEQEDRECIENIKMLAILIHEEYSKIGDALDGQPLCESYMALKVMAEYVKEEINDDSKVLLMDRAAEIMINYAAASAEMEKMS